MTSGAPTEQTSTCRCISVVSRLPRTRSDVPMAISQMPTRPSRVLEMVAASRIATHAKGLRDGGTADVLGRRDLGLRAARDGHSKHAQVPVVEPVDQRVRSRRYALTWSCSEAGEPGAALRCAGRASCSSADLAAHRARTVLEYRSPTSIVRRDVALADTATHSMAGGVEANSQRRRDRRAERGEDAWNSFPTVGSRGCAALTALLATPSAELIFFLGAGAG